MSDLIKREDAIEVVCELVPIRDDAVEIADAIRAIPSADIPQGDVDAVEIYERAERQLERGEISLGGFEDIIEPLRHLFYGRPQGEWVPATWQDENCPERLKKHKCSVCGEKAERILVRTELIDNYYCNKCEPITEYTHQEQLSDYCPHCGAYMKGVDDE